MEEVLGEQMGWRTFMCVAKERIDADEDRAGKDHAIGQNFAMPKEKASGL